MSSFSSCSDKPPRGHAVKADYPRHKHSPCLINLLLHRAHVKLWKAIKAAAQDTQGGSLSAALTRAGS